MGTAHAVDGQPGGRVLDYEHAGPTVSRMLVGALLRRLREAKGISREDAGKAIRASESKISRLELGRTGFKMRDVVDLLALYGMEDEAETATLLALVRQSNVPAWWHAHSDVLTSWFSNYVGLEQGASMIRTYEVQFIPGLLQTEEYARAVHRLDPGEVSEEELERRVSVRMRRQEILRAPDPPHLWAVVDEAALRRPIGGAAVMRAQITRLIEEARRPNITVQVLPFSAGGHAAAGGPITILRFTEPELPDVVYLEQLTSAVYPDRPADMQHYWNVLNRLVTEAEPPDATEEILNRILADT